MTGRDDADGGRALVVRGGWEGHDPLGTTGLFLPFLREHFAEVLVSDTLEPYADPGLLAGVDLVVQCWSMGEITREQAKGLSAAVRAGTGFAGWHGGVLDSFRGELRYQVMVGGQFMAHPGDRVRHQVRIVPERAGHPVVSGLDTIELETEQYWVLTDSAIDVLATTVLSPGPDDPWPEPLCLPVVWTRRWGRGRVFVSAVGHDTADLSVPAVRTLTRRGLLWASR